MEFSQRDQTGPWSLSWISELHLRTREEPRMGGGVKTLGHPLAMQRRGQGSPSGAGSWCQNQQVDRQNSMFSGKLANRGWLEYGTKPERWIFYGDSISVPKKLWYQILKMTKL